MEKKPITPKKTYKKRFTKRLSQMETKMMAYAFAGQVYAQENPIYFPKRHTKMSYAAQNRLAKRRRRAK